MFENLLHQSAELRRTGKIAAIARYINTGEHDFAITIVDQPAYIFDDSSHRHRARIATAERNDTKRAAVIAAVLHLHKSARPAGESIDEMRRCFFYRHNVVDDRFGRTLDRKSGPRLHPTGSGELLPVAKDAIGFGHGRECLRLRLRRTAGHDDFGLRTAAAQRPDGLPRLADGFRSHRAGIDHNGVVEPGARRLAANDFRFGGIEPAAERDNLDAHSAAPNSANSAASKRP